MKILVVGASSGIGLHAVRECLSRGCEVRAMSRGADGISITHPDLEPFPGDARDPGDVGRALQGIDSVVVTLGIRERPSMVWETETLFSDATRVLLSAMEQSSTRRLVVVTGFGSGRSREAMSALERLGHGAILGRVYADKSRQETLITDSDLDWTIVRPVILTNGEATGRFEAIPELRKWRNGLISRADVAAYIISAALNGLNMREDVVLRRSRA